MQDCAICGKRVSKKTSRLMLTMEDNSWCEKSQVDILLLLFLPTICKHWNGYLWFNIEKWWLSILFVDWSSNMSKKPNGLLWKLDTQETTIRRSPKREKKTCIGIQIENFSLWKWKLPNPIANLLILWHDFFMFHAKF